MISCASCATNCIAPVLKVLQIVFESSRCLRGLFMRHEVADGIGWVRYGEYSGRPPVCFSWWLTGKTLCSTTICPQPQPITAVPPGVTESTGKSIRVPKSLVSCHDCGDAHVPPNGSMIGLTKARRRHLAAGDYSWGLSGAAKNELEAGAWRSFAVHTDSLQGADEQ